MEVLRTRALRVNAVRLWLLQRGLKNLADNLWQRNRGRGKQGGRGRGREEGRLRVGKCVYARENMRGTTRPLLQQQQ